MMPSGPRDGLFVDHEFPPTRDSLFPGGVVPSRYRQDWVNSVYWKRAAELVRNPFFELDGHNRLDVDQGALGDCWFLGAAAVLASGHPNLFHRVVPRGQGFEPHRYTGRFHFNFWVFGEWREVVVDDYLPVNHRGLVFVKNREHPNEFWPCLLEKAFAKLHGGYMALERGRADHALVMLTGGIPENVQLRPLDGNTPPLAAPELYRLLEKSFRMNSLLMATVSEDNQAVQPDLGLQKSHSYSITGFAEAVSGNRRDKLLRVLNPLGNEEWRGAWSDSSPEMASLSAEKRRDMMFVKKEDGEFWMKFDDFHYYFDFLLLCHLQPDSLISELQNNEVLTQWRMAEHHGQWRGAVTPGDMTDQSTEYWSSPQYTVTLKAPDNVYQHSSTLVVSLMGKYLSGYQDAPPLGLDLFEVRNFQGQPLSVYNKSQWERKHHSRMLRSLQLTERFQLTVGRSYVLLPFTLKPFQGAQFLLRLVAEKPFDTGELSSGSSETNHATLQDMPSFQTYDFPVAKPAVYRSASTSQPVASTHLFYSQPAAPSSMPYSQPSTTPNMVYDQPNLTANQTTNHATMSHKQQLVDPAIPNHATEEYSVPSNISAHRPRQPSVSSQISTHRVPQNTRPTTTLSGTAGTRVGTSHPTSHDDGNSALSSRRKNVPPNLKTVRPTTPPFPVAPENQPQNLPGNYPQQTNSSNFTSRITYTSNNMPLSYNGYHAAPTITLNRHNSCLDVTQNMQTPVEGTNSYAINTNSTTHPARTASFSHRPMADQTGANYSQGTSSLRKRSSSFGGRRQYSQSAGTTSQSENRTATSSSNATTTLTTTTTENVKKPSNKQVTTNDSRTYWLNNSDFIDAPSGFSSYAKYEDKKSIVPPRSPPGEQFTKTYNKHDTNKTGLGATFLRTFLEDISRLEWKDPLKVTVEMCRALIYHADSSRNGRLNSRETLKLWREINAFKDVYDRFSNNTTGTVDATQLGVLFEKLGFPVGISVQQALVTRFGTASNRTLSLRDFIIVLFKLTSLFESFDDKRNRKAGEEVATFTRDEFLKASLFI